MTAYDIVLMRKLKRADIPRAEAYIKREANNHHGDPSRMSQNVPLHGGDNWTRTVNERIDGLPYTFRKDGVAAIEYVFTGSPRWFREASGGELGQWIDRNVQWLKNIYGADRLVGAHLHMDQTTANMHALVMPITDAGRFSARDYTGGAFGGQKVSRQLDSHVHAVSDLGFVRGTPNSIASHETVKEWLHNVTAPVPHVRDILRGIEVEPTPSGTDPVHWARGQTEKIREVMRPHLEIAYGHITHVEHQNDILRGNNEMLRQRADRGERGAPDDPHTSDQRQSREGGMDMAAEMGLNL